MHSFSLFLSLKRHIWHTCTPTPLTLQTHMHALSLLHLHLSLNHRGHWGTTDNFTTRFLHFFLSPLPSGTWKTPGLSIPWCCLSTPSSACLVFFPLSPYLALCFGQTWWMGDKSIPLQFASVYDGQVFMWSDYLPDLGTDFLVGNMVFVWDAWYLTVAPHFHDSYSSLHLCCEGTWFPSEQENGCDKGAHQLYLERNTPVVPNWFQPCQCCRWNILGLSEIIIILIIVCSFLCHFSFGTQGPLHETR